MIDSADLRTVRQLAAECPAFTQDSLRWHIFNSRDNGLTELGAIVRVGRRVYLRKSRFDRWVAGEKAA